MKLYPYTEDNKKSPFYQNELRAAELDHPNICSPVYFEECCEFTVNDTIKLFSAIYAPYAAYGDFFNLITGSNVMVDEKIVRTLFIQLAKGLQYMHSKGYSHLDLKPENLVLADDFSLKIIDFDLIHHENDDGVKGRGSSCYRAPELLKSRPNIDAKKCDVYSAGMILFIMKS